MVMEEQARLLLMVSLGTNPFEDLGAHILIFGGTLLLVLLPALVHPVRLTLLLRDLLALLEAHSLALLHVLCSALLIVLHLAAPLYHVLALLHLLYVALLCGPGFTLLLPSSLAVRVRDL